MGIRYITLDEFSRRVSTDTFLYGLSEKWGKAEIDVAANNGETYFCTTFKQQHSLVMHNHTVMLNISSLLKQVTNLTYNNRYNLHKRRGRKSKFLLIGILNKNKDWIIVNKTWNLWVSSRNKLWSHRYHPQVKSEYCWSLK